MRDYSLSHLSDPVLLRDLTCLVSRERFTIADVLAHIAEVDARKLYAPAGHSSMFVYCVKVLGFSEDETGKRIQAARAARQYPALFTALAEGKLHLTAVCLLAPHLTSETVDELIEEASHRSKSEIEDFLWARYRFGSSVGTSPAQCEIPSEPAGGEPGTGDNMLRRMLLGSPSGAPEHAPEHVLGSLSGSEHVPEHVRPHRDLPSRDSLCQITVRQSTRETLRYAQAILSHAIPGGDASDVLDRALKLLIAKTERRRFGASTRPRAAARTGEAARPERRARHERRARRAASGHIPAHVRHAVWNRDRGRCTFVGTDGIRCDAQRFVEFDHVDPRNKENTVEGLRLRCRTHNQPEAERVFGAEFMARKRAEARARLEAQARARSGAEAVTKDQIKDVIAGLRNLGVRYLDAKRAAESTLTMESPTLEDRMRAALSTITPRRQPRIRPIPPPERPALQSVEAGEHAPEHVAENHEPAGLAKL